MEKIAIDILSINSNHCGGKDQVAFNLLDGLSELNLIQNVTIFCLKEIEEEIKTRYKSANIIVVNLKKITNKKSLNLMIFRSFYFRKYLNENNITKILYTQDNIGLRKIKKIKSVFIPHDIQIITDEKQNFFNKIFYKIQYFMDFKNADRVIAISKFDKKEMIKYYGNKIENKIKIIYNPIKFVKKIEKETKERTIIAINLQHKHKNIITLIKAFENIMNEVEHNLILIGKLNFNTFEIQKYVKEKKIEDRVKFTGFLTEKEMYKKLSRSELYVNPSLYEGFGMTAIEAMFLKIPTIVSRVTASEEVTKGLCNYYNNPLDYKELSQKILEVLKSENCELENIKKEIENEYSHKKIALDYWKFLKNL